MSTGSDSDAADIEAAGQMLRAWARSARPADRLRAEEQRAWRSIWPELAGLGLLSAGVPDDRGGGGGTTADQASLLALASELLVPGPLLGTATAALLLAAERDPGAVRALDDLVEGRRPGALATPSAGAAYTERSGAGACGDFDVVVGAEADSWLLLPVRHRAGVRWALVDAGSRGVVLESRQPLDRSQSAVAVRLRDAPVAAWLTASEKRVDALHLTLAASVASGTTVWTTRTAADHARVREQFGRPIGSFQAVKHLCAEMHCRSQQARVAARDAAEAHASPEAGQRILAAAVAGALVFDLAVDNAKDCVQVLGGIGYTWEHDAHFQLRKALVLRQLFDGRRSARELVALTRSGVRRDLRVELGPEGLPQEERQELRELIARLRGLPSVEQRQQLAEAGLAWPALPAPYGRSATAGEELAIRAELAAAGIALPDLVIGAWALPTILAHGTTQQAERFVAPTLRGDLVWCQLFSETAAGSDLASVSTRARRTAGGWLLDGQKVWTSLAHEADWGIALARTSTPARGASRRHGLTYFLVDMRQTGVTVRPIREITGDSLFNEVFLDGVLVPDECVVGEVDEGWTVARTTLSNERVEMAGTTPSPELEALAVATDTDTPDDAAIGGLLADAAVLALLAHRTMLARVAGREAEAGSRPESGVVKLLGVRHAQELSEFRLSRIGALGAAESGESHEFLYRRAWSIAGGSTQILLTAIGERILGLPR